MFDAAPLFKKFGDVLTDVNSAYKAGNSVSAVFQAANPRVSINHMHIRPCGFLMLLSLTE